VISWIQAFAFKCNLCRYKLGQVSESEFHRSVVKNNRINPQKRSHVPTGPSGPPATVPPNHSYRGRRMWPRGLLGWLLHAGMLVGAGALGHTRGAEIKKVVEEKYAVRRCKLNSVDL
jgi:hypothetical protein